MKLFIDTANLEQIKQANALGILDGVTTNPSLMAKEGISGSQNIIDHYKSICDLVEGDVSAEVIATDVDGMIKEGSSLADISPNIVIKLPMTADGLKACSYFCDRGIGINMTLVFSVGQALLAIKAGARYISPFVGRLDDISTNGLKLISDIHKIINAYLFDTQVLVASVRHPMHIVESAIIGADVATCPLSVIESLLKHPLTDIGLEKFLADHKKANPKT
ncbi:MAG: fructose-6-phosphate aldolase [Tenacibaculum sp.]